MSLRTQPQSGDCEYEWFCPWVWSERKVAYIKILIYYSTFLQTKASQFKSFRDQANQTLHSLQFKINLFLFMFVLFYWSFVCISAYANVYFKTTIIRQNIKMIPFNTTSWVRGPLRECRSIRSGASRLPYYCTPLVCISVVIELRSVWQHNKPKTKNQKPKLRLLKMLQPIVSEKRDVRALSFEHSLAESSQNKKN